MGKTESERERREQSVKKIDRQKMEKRKMARKKEKQNERKVALRWLTD